MENCLECDSADRCTECAGNFILEFETYGPECINPEFPHCTTVNAFDGTICDECDKWYGRSDDGHFCVPCQDYESGCADCLALEENENYSYGGCTACAFPMTLEEGECELEACVDVKYETDGGAYMDPVECLLCEDFFGLRDLDKTCHPCEKKLEFWDWCLDCEISNGGDPVSCYDCVGDRVLENIPEAFSETLPAQICKFPDIANCEYQDAEYDGHCEKCESTYHLSDDKFSCIACDLNNCLDCYGMAAGDFQYQTCIHCADSYNLVSEWFEYADGYVERDVCAHTESLPHCITVVDETDAIPRVTCAECEAGYWWDNSENVWACTPCGDAIDECTECAINDDSGNLECSVCNTEWYIKFEDKTCWQHHCEEFSTNDGEEDYCWACSEGYFWEDGLCVESCDGANYEDTDYMICR